MTRYNGLPALRLRSSSSFGHNHSKMSMRILWNRTDRKFLVMINSNKLPRLYWQELYTERMRAVAYFSQNGNIDLYGREWDQPSHRLGQSQIPYTIRLLSRKLHGWWHYFRPDPLLQAARKVYRGTTPSKSETLSQYTFALCFENMSLKGWITEKIFDCFFVGTIPIYWGEPEIERHIPANCFIDMRQFANYAELQQFLYSLSPKAIQEYKENARSFLQSPKFRPFSKDAFFDLFWRIIREDAGVTLPT